MACVVVPSLGVIFFNSKKGAFKHANAASSSQEAWIMVPLGMPSFADDSNILTNLSVASWSAVNFACASMESQSIQLCPRQLPPLLFGQCLSYSKPRTHSIFRLRFHRIFCTVNKKVEIINGNYTRLTPSVPKVLLVP